MRYDIDFSIFESPNDPYGNVTGELELESLPPVGTIVEVLQGTLALRVQLINYVNGRPVIMFNDVVAESPKHAALLAERLERDEGLLTDPTGLDPWYREPAVRRREAIAREARASSGSEAWSIYKSHPNTKAFSSRPFGIGQFKCNLFVHDTLGKAGQSPGLAGNGLPPVACDWYGGSVLGFTEIPPNLASNGGIVVKVYPGHGSYTGHVGIVVGPNQTASQSSITDNIVINDYGFRPEDEGQSKFYRCECAR